MSAEDKKDEAAEKAVRAAKQFKHSARNTGGAAEAAAEYVAEEAAEVADKVTDGLRARASRVQPHVMAYAVRQVGWGFVAMSLSVYTGAIAANKFKTAFDMRKAFLTKPQP